VSDLTFNPELGPERPDITIDSPVNMRPELAPLGIDEVERGICQDTFGNRAILRRNKMGWDPVYSTNGVPTGLIQARSDEMAKARRVLSLAEKKPILVDPDHMNSDYITGYDLLAESAADYLVPPWVVGATKTWLKEQEAGGLPAGSKRKPAALPTRCRAIKDDGIRCMMWSSGRPADDGYCRVHLGAIQRKPGEDVERARAKLTQAAPYAVDVLEELMETAASEPVRLKASTEILDRAGVRGGVEFDAKITLQDARDPAEIVAERLQRLAAGASQVAAVLEQAGIKPVIDQDDSDIQDAEIEESPE
jgi:hypothetical protein